MNKWKRLVLCIFILVFMTVFVVIAVKVGDMRMTLSDYIERGKLCDLNLKIYYMHPNILTLFPVPLELYLNDIYFSFDILVDGSELEDHTDLLKRIIKASYIVAESDLREQVRLYYVFETKKGRKVFDVLFSSTDGKIIVNGVAVEQNYAFYELMTHFLPAELAEVVEGYGLANLSE